MTGFFLEEKVSTHMRNARPSKERTAPPRTYIARPSRTVPACQVDMLIDRLFTDPFRRCWLHCYARQHEGRGPNPI